MALSQSQIQTLQQKLSPQQIQFIKLLQMNTLDFEERMTEELLDNPALEKTDGETEYEETSPETEKDWDDDRIDVDEMLRASGADVVLAELLKEGQEAILLLVSC